MKNIFFFWLLLLCFQSNAQTFTNYTTADGLISNTVNCLALNSDNNLWFGTQDGISFFDGSTWTNYNKTTHPNLIDNTIKCIAVDSDNAVWVGTDFGISRFDGTNWTNYTTADGLEDDRVKYIKQGPDGRMWFANNDGISILDGTSWTSYTMADGLPFGGTNFVAFDTNGKAHLGTPLGGVQIFDGTTWTEITENDGLLNDRIRSIAFDGSGNKWIGNADGVSVFDANNNFLTNHEIIFELPPPDLLNPVEDVQIDSKGRIWVGVYVDYLVTEGGVTFFDGSTWTDYDVSDGLVGPVVRRLVIDGADNVWVATSTGISKISNVPVNTFDLTLDAKIELFPNPSAADIVLQLPYDLIGSTFQIHNAEGRLLLRGVVDQTSMKFDLNTANSGLYYLSIDGGYTREFIIQK